MMRAAVLAVLLVGIALQPAAAEPFHREDLRIPMEAAGPRGLEVAVGGERADARHAHLAAMGVAGQHGVVPVLGEPVEDPEVGRVRDSQPHVRVGVGRSGDRLPLTLQGGGLKRIAYRLPEPSAQVKSAVLLAGLNAEGGAQVIEPEPTRDHTERMLRAFGAQVQVQDTPEGRVITLAGGQSLSAAPVRVPGDPSSAAFPLVAALVTPGSEVTVEGVLLNPLRAGLFETLREMGADLTVENLREEGGEQVGDLTARHSVLRGVVAPPERAPSMIDEYPILAAAAAFAQGPTVMRGIGEMRVKESDRIALMAQGLAACGVDVQEEPEGLIVTGGAGRPAAGGARVTTRGDHRIAMSHLVLGLAAEAAVEVDEPGMIATSFPGFVALMRGLGAEIAEQQPAAA